MARTQVSQEELAVLRAIRHFEQVDRAPTLQLIAQLTNATYPLVRPLVNRLLERGMITAGLGLTDEGRAVVDAADERPSR